MVLIQLEYNKFRYNFQGSLDPFCYFSVSSITKIVFGIFLVKQNDAVIIEILRFEWKCLSNICKTMIITVDLEYTSLAKDFNKPLIWIIWNKMCVIQMPNTSCSFPVCLLVFSRFLFLLLLLLLLFFLSILPFWTCSIKVEFNNYFFP